ncbi:MAG: tautomerase family protein [Desulfobacteraceae bacterium]|nr:tautomerase family protein [Desulfobacteraceae bacterium]
MPTGTIEVRKKWPLKEKKKLIKLVHGAMIDALKIPEHDRLIRVIEHEPELFAAPPGSSENYTLVEISMFPGRSLAAKRKLYKKIVENLSTLGIPAKDIRIVLHEVPMDNWGIRGGVPASEVDIGFKVDV